MLKIRLVEGFIKPKLSKLTLVLDKYLTLNKTKEDFSPETRPWLKGMKSLRKMLKIRLVEGY